MTKSFESFLEPPKLQIEFWKACNGFEIYILRDDKSFLNLGSKLRRFQGFRYLDSKKPILLEGSLGSNFLITFTLLFALSGFRIYTLAKSYETSPKSINYQLLKKYSTEIQFGDYKSLLLAKQSIIETFPDIQTIPKYGFSREGELGYQSLWKDIEVQNFGTLLLDIGSGLSFLSAKKYFQNRNVNVLGLSLGESKESWLKHLPNNIESLNWNKEDIPLDANFRDSITNPIILKKFASINKTLINFIQATYKDSGLPLEPVYSAKSLFTLLYYLEEPKLNHSINDYGKKEIDHRFKERLSASPNKKILYIHQGGLLSWYKLFTSNLENLSTGMHPHTN